MTSKITAPFTSEQGQALADYQDHGTRPPLICGAIHATGRSPLLAPTHSGWICPDPACGYTQDWAWTYMATSAPGSAA